MVWNNTPRKVYHGTIDPHVAAISGGVNPAAGRGAADFGQGFYVTTDLHQAEQWANQKARSMPSAPNAAVLTFELDRDLIATLGDHLTFVLADIDFYDFVLFNRFGSPSHKRSSGYPYDVVYGPVAAHPQTISFSGCDQICFVAGGRNVTKAIQALTLVSHISGTPLF